MDECWDQVLTIVKFFIFLIKYKKIKNKTINQIQTDSPWSNS